MCRFQHVRSCLAVIFQSTANITGTKYTTHKAFHVEQFFQLESINAIGIFFHANSVDVFQRIQSNRYTESCVVCRVFRVEFRPLGHLTFVVCWKLSNFLLYTHDETQDQITS